MTSVGTIDKLLLSKRNKLERKHLAMTTVNGIINNFAKRPHHSFEEYEQEVEFAIFELLGLSRNEFIQDWVTEEQYMKLQSIQSNIAYKNNVNPDRGSIF